MCNCKKGKSSAPKAKAQIVSTQAAQLPIVRSGPRKMAQRNFAASTNSNVASTSALQNLAGETFADKCLTFGYVLGLDQAVPEKVLYAALEDSGYAKRLLSNRNKPALYDLLNNPPTFSGVSLNRSFLNGQLITKAGKALLNWGLAGFPTVSKATLKKREDACLQCPNLKASSNILQRISASSEVSDEIGNRTGNKSCALCGCVVKNKMRLSTETCPDAVPSTPGFNRWGEKLP